MVNKLQLNFRYSAFLIFFGLFFSSSVRAQLSLEVFAKQSEYVSVKLSPDGKYFAVVMRVDGKRKLVVYDSKTIEHVGLFSFRGDDEVGQIQWVNNERIVMSVLQQSKWEEELENYGELYAVNFDGKSGRMIFGYRAGVPRSDSRRATHGWARIIDYLPSDDKHVLISSEAMSEENDGLSKVYKLNVYSGKMHIPITRAPIPSAIFITDQQSNLRLAYGKSKNGDIGFFKYEQGEGKWIELPSSLFGSHFQALRFDESGNNLYILDNYGQDKTGFFKLSLETGKRQHLYTHENVDISDVIFSSDQNSVYALNLDDGYSQGKIMNVF